MKALTNAIDRTAHQKLIAENAAQALTLAYNGGLFEITTELLAFVHIWEGDRPMYLKDSYNNPIKIDDARDFFKQASKKYEEVMNDWHNEFEAFKNIRKTEQL